MTTATSAAGCGRGGHLKNAIYFEILLEGKTIRGVGAKWLETINEAG
jgi:hypothetical protein